MNHHREQGGYVECLVESSAVYCRRESDRGLDKPILTISKKQFLKLRSIIRKGAFTSLA